MRPRFGSDGVGGLERRESVAANGAEYPRNMAAMEGTEEAGRILAWRVVMERGMGGDWGRHVVCCKEGQCSRAVVW